MKYAKVMKVEDLKTGKSVIISVGNNEIALFNYKGKYYAVTNKCPHKGSPLGEGRIEEGVLICPGHEWRFDLNNGNCMQNPYMKIFSYPVRVKKEHIYLGLEPIVEEEEQLTGKESSNLPSDLKFKVPTIQQPRNPEEEL